MLLSVEMSAADDILIDRRQGRNPIARARKMSSAPETLGRCKFSDWISLRSLGFPYTNTRGESESERAAERGRLGGVEDTPLYKHRHASV